MRKNFSDQHGAANAAACRVLHYLAIDIMSSNETGCREFGISLGEGQNPQKIIVHSGRAAHLVACYTWRTITREICRMNRRTLDSIAYWRWELYEGSEIFGEEDWLGGMRSSRLIRERLAFIAIAEAVYTILLQRRAIYDAEEDWAA